MLTDEQRMREQFEKWIDEKQYGLGWQDGRGTWEEFLSATWAGYKAGQLARDAEVQALRQALTEVTNELEAEVNHRYGFDPATGEVKGLARRYEVDISVVRMARAVLAGEEANDE